MVKAGGPVDWVMQVGADGADDEEIDRLTRTLLGELRELPVEVRLAPGGPPAKGAKASALMTAGELAITALPGVLASVVTFLCSWLKRGEGRSLKIKWADGQRSFAVDLPSGELSHDQMRKLLATLGAAGPDTGRKAAGPPQ